MVVDAFQEGFHISFVTTKSSSVEVHVVSFHMELSNGIEINKENTNLESFTYLLQSFGALC